MKYKIISFTKFPNTDDDCDCIAINERGTSFYVDPFVGCAWEYENREHLLNQWFETENEHWHENAKLGLRRTLLPAENDFKLLASLTDKKE